MDYKDDNIWTMHGDCLERMKEIPSDSVDMILTDPPYGTVKGMVLKGQTIKTTSWDDTLDHELMLSECNRILRTNGGLVLFSQDPYTAKLMIDTHRNLPFSYRLTWLKDHFASPLSANKAPVNYTEDVCVFFKKYDTLGQHPLRDYSKSIFDRIGKSKRDIFSDMRHQGVCHFMRYDSMQFTLCTEKTYDDLIERYDIDKMDGFIHYQDMYDIHRRFTRRFNLPDGQKFKSNILQYKKDYTGLHPTQKPVALMEDLIKTYTNEGETVLDFTMGSGTTGVACLNTSRKFIGIEMDENYYYTALSRLLTTSSNQCNIAVSPSME